MAAYALPVVLGVGLLLIVLGLVKMVLENDNTLPTEQAAVEEPSKAEQPKPVRLRYDVGKTVITVRIWNEYSDRNYQAVGWNRSLCQTCMVSIDRGVGRDEIITVRATGVLQFDEQGVVRSFSAREEGVEFDGRHILRPHGVDSFGSWSWNIPVEVTKRSA